MGRRHTAHMFTLVVFFFFGGGVGETLVLLLFEG